jgi:hypothetical protein
LILTTAILKTMLPSLFKICCRQLVQALRCTQAAEGEATFFLGFDSDGSLFYKVGNTLGGQLMSVCTEPLAFCPFCGRRVAGGEVAGAERNPTAERISNDDEEEATILALEVTREIETVLALQPGHDSGGRIHVADF